VRAPFDGIITGVEVSVGDQVAKGAVLVTLFALDGVEVRARVPAPYQAELVQALADAGTLSAETRLGDLGLELALERISGEADPSGVDGLFRVVGDPTTLRLGQTLALRLQRPARDNVVAVPFRAVYGGGRIYKLVDGRMQGVDVESLGELASNGTADERLLVRSPEIKRGDLIVTTHMPNAIEGLRVETLEQDRMAKARQTPDGPGAESAGGETQVVQ
jgi:HlyD family secretion protein